MLEMKVVEGLRAALEQHKPPKLLLSALALLRELIVSEGQEKGRVLKILESQGVIKEAEKVSGHDLREVYDRFDLLQQTITFIKESLQETG